MDFLLTGTNLLLIVLGFSLLIFVHELGHFLAARWAGIRVEGFSLGMGPAILSYRKGIGVRAGSSDRETIRRFGKPAILMSDAELAHAGVGETEYTIRALPLGGFVRMLGQEDANPSAVSDDPRSYQRRPIGKRMVVVSAGVAMNLLLAVLLFLIAFLVGVRFDAPVIGGVVVDSPAASAVAEVSGGGEPTGLRAGDHVEAIDGKPTATFADLVIASAMGDPETPIRLSVRRPGVDEMLSFEVTPRKDPRTGLLSIGVVPASSTTVTAERASRREVEKILDRLGLAAQGVRPGMRIESADGVAVRTYQQIRKLAAESNGEPLAATWIAEGSSQPVEAAIPVEPEWDGMLTPLGSEVTQTEGIVGLAPLALVASISEDSPNAEILRVDDVFLRIGDFEGPTVGDVYQTVRSWKDTTIPARVLRGDQELDLELKLNSKNQIGVNPASAWDVPLIAKPLDRVRGPNNALVATPVAPLRLFARSRLVSVAGTPISDWPSFRAALRDATADADGSEPIRVPIEFGLPLPEGGNEEFEITLSPDEVVAIQSLGWQPALSPALFDPEFVTLKASGPLDAVRMGFAETKKLVLLTYLTLDRVIRGSIGVDQLRGPVGIVHAGITVADQGFMYLVFFVAMLSVNLAVINFLPLPIVDGGLFLFLVYEKLRGRPPSIGFQNAATAVGLVIIGSVFLITFYNDIARLIG